MSSGKADCARDVSQSGSSFQLAKTPGSFKLAVPGPSSQTARPSISTPAAAAKPKSVMYEIRPPASGLRNSPAPPRPKPTAGVDDDDVEIIPSDRPDTSRSVRPVEARGRKRYSEDHEDGEARAQRIVRAQDEENIDSSAMPQGSSGRESQTKVTQLTRDVLMANTTGTQAPRDTANVPSTTGSGNNKLAHVRLPGRNSGVLVWLLIRDYATAFHREATSDVGT